MAINWPAIKVRWEAGETAYTISKALGGTPSKQAIDKRAKKQGWLKPGAEGNSGWLPVAGKLPIVQDGNRKLATPERLAVVLEHVACGAPEYLAAQAAGMSNDTLIRYKADCPELAAQIEVAKATKAIERVKRIETAGKAGDWKADKFLLENDPTTKAHFSQKERPGLNITLSIHRERVDVQGQTIIDPTEGSR